ncbi:OPT oligopeptide transporter [Hysterangium stoloniferum]|nr:OPT oligopeptide transporter [Hysterangium stoloniferum]
MTRNNENANTDKHDLSEAVDQLPHASRPASIDKSEISDEKLELEKEKGHQTVVEADENLYDENGREKVLETAADFATALVSLDDDPTMPIHTFRMWFSGLGLAVFGSVLGMLFGPSDNHPLQQFRPQVISVSALFLQLIAYMLGKLFEVVIPGPGSRFHTGSRFWNFMNPGPFNIKEHVAAQIMANTAAGAALACFVFAADDLFYNITVNSGNAIFTLLASQLLGYGFAGMFRSFLVYPTAMLYPQNLIYVNLFDVLHRSKGELLQGKRLRFFWIVVGAVFVYEWFPEYIAPLLGSFNIVCLAARDSAWVSYIFGGAEANEGMGLLGFGLDWANITSSPFYSPLSTQLSQYIGWALNYLILPAVFARNVWHSQNFPFISQNLFFENGTIYNQSLILNPDFSLNRTAFEIVGQPWLSGSSVIFNLGITLAIGATFTHIALWYGKDLLSAAMDYFKGTPVNDPHYLKMKIYKEVPLWWYAGLAVGGMGVFILLYCQPINAFPWINSLRYCHTYRSFGTADANNLHLSRLPPWALIVALIVALITLPFYGAMVAIAAYAPPMGTLFRILGAAVVPGSSQANMASFMLSDLKLGQYTKLPPREDSFNTVCIILTLRPDVIMQTVINNERPILLSNEGSRVWSGQQIQSFNADAILWGALGKEIYGPQGSYFIVPLGIVIGLALPVIPWLMYRKLGWSWLRYVNTAVLASNMGDLAGGTNGYINTWMAIGLTSHFYIRKYRAGWFRKYNYLFGAGIDGGAQIFVFIFSFALAGAGGVATPFPTWALNPEGNADYCKVTDQ